MDETQKKLYKKKYATNISHRWKSLEINFMGKFLENLFSTSTINRRCNNQCTEKKVRKGIFPPKHYLAPIPTIRFPSRDLRMCAMCVECLCWTFTTVWAVSVAYLIFRDFLNLWLTYTVYFEIQTSCISVAGANRTHVHTMFPFSFLFWIMNTVSLSDYVIYCQFLLTQPLYKLQQN